MPDFPLKETAGAVATLAVGLLGYLQWKRTRLSGKSIEERESAYKAVWDATEEAHLLVRSDAFKPALFNDAVLRVNTLLLQRSLYITEPDRRAVAEYVAALAAFAEVLRTERVPDAVEHEISLTAEFGPLPSAYAETFSRVQTSRQEVIDRFRKAIGANAM